MKKEGFGGLFNSDDGKVNSRLFFLIVFIIGLTVYLGIFAQGLGTIIFNNVNVSNSNISNFSVSSIQINCTAIATETNFSGTNISIVNVTLNITTFNGGLIYFNTSNNTVAISDAAYSLTNDTIIFNLTIPEGIYQTNCTSFTNSSGADRIGNSTANLTIRIDLSSPIINATNSNNLTYKTPANGNRTGNTINITITANDLLTGVRNITILRNGTNVNSTIISENTTTTINYLIRGVDINNVFNFTINVSDFVQRTSLTDGVLVSVTSDGTPPAPIDLNSPINGTNQTGTSITLNFTASDNNGTATLNCSINVTNSGDGEFTSIKGLNVTNGTAHVNTTTTALTNGTYNWSVTCRDPPGNTNSSSAYRLFTVDQIPPRNDYFNITNSSVFTSQAGDEAAIPLGLSTGLPSDTGKSSAQGRTFFIKANWTDNLTQPLRGELQMYNGSSSQWITAQNGTNISESNVTPFANGGWLNLTFSPLVGHNMFEGKNISFRVVANDTLNNKNTSVVLNLTIQVNDTTRPTLLVSSVAGGTVTNLSNTTNAKPTIAYNVTENNALRNISVQVNSLTEDACGFKKFTTTANANRNGTLDVFSAAGCPALANGTHTIRLTSEDDWGNSELYIHTFVIDTEPPSIVLAQTNSTVGANGTTTNTTTVGISVNISDRFSTIRSFQFSTSCDSTVRSFTNDTTFFPFNFSGCQGSSGNRTLTINATDSSGSSNVSSFIFEVDNVAPSNTVIHSPTSGQLFNSNVTLNLSVKDDINNISFFGYVLDNSDVVNQLNFSAIGFGGEGQNLTKAFSVNFTPGTHTIRFQINDSVGNVVRSSNVTFTQSGPIYFTPLFNVSAGTNGSLGTYNTNMSNITLYNASGEIVTDTRETNQTFILFIALNTTTNNVNVSLVFNGSAARWQNVNFTVQQNTSKVFNGIQNNQSTKIIEVVTFNTSIDDFISDAGYYGTVKFPSVNTSDIGTNVKVQWYENAIDLRTPTNVTICPATFAPSVTDNSNMPCWNNTDNRSITVFVPHFSHVVLANDTITPSVTVNIPLSTQTLISFVPNITVTDDTKNCTYTYNASGAQTSEISMTLTEGTTESTCVGSIITNLTNGTGFVNITFYVYDTSGNLNQTSLNFSVNDTTPQNISSITISGVSSSAATISITSNESVNMSINSTGSNSFTNPTPKSTFATTQSISLSSLAASKTFNLTVITCDRANNCLTNTTLGFTTSAAAAAAAAAEAAAAGAAGGGAAAPSNVEASAGRQWDSLASGSSGVLTINNEKIAVTGVIVDVKNAVTNPSITVESLTSNPLSTAAAAKVYQYLQLKKGNIADTDASKITINFRVPKSWLTSNGVAESNILLWRYSNGWSQLDTKLVSSDSSYARYEAITPGFSTFAIGTREAGISAFAIIDMIRDFYAGTSKLTAFDIIDQIRAFYGG